MPVNDSEDRYTTEETVLCHLCGVEWNKKGISSHVRGCTWQLAELAFDRQMAQEAMARPAESKDPEQQVALTRYGESSMLSPLSIGTNDESITRSCRLQRAGFGYRSTGWRPACTVRVRGTSDSRR